MLTGYCSCPRGATRALCKHKDAVSKHFGIANFTTMPMYDAQARKNYLFIASGKFYDDTFLRPFCPTTTRTTTITTTSTSTVATSTVTTSTTTVSSSASVSLLNTVPTSSLISETNLTTMISTARANVSNDLLAFPNTNNNVDSDNSDNDDIRDDDVRDDDDRDDDDRDDDDRDEAFIAGDEQLEDNDGNIEEEMQDFDEDIEHFKASVREKWGKPTVRRAFKSFKKGFKRTLQNENTLIRVMFNFAKETSPNINVGRKRKQGSQITVQSTAKSRRRYQSVGRSVATYGRKEKVVEKRSQIVFNEDNDTEGTWHSFPRVTRSQTKKPHNLSETIKNNVSAARKHEKTMFE